MVREVFSLCFMCSIRCPIRVKVENGHVVWIEGNPHVPGIDRSLCPRGSAGKSLLYDDQRIQTPLIRDGNRGSGKWRKANWEEAINYVSDRLMPIIKKNGGHSVVLMERTQMATHVSKTFLKAIKSPNHFTHDALCKGSVNTACRSMFGLTDGQVGIHYKKTRHIVLYGRNIFESINVKEVNTLMYALENGAKLTYIDPRVNVTASKAHRYWMIRPGTDLALNYSLIHIILKERLYDEKFVTRWVHGFAELREFVETYTPEWAQDETGIDAREIVALAREMSQDKPSVIFHYGYRGANHVDEIYMRRSLLILNTLMGSIESKGGLFFKKGPGYLGKNPARKLTEQKFPTIEKIRCDKVGTKDFPLPDPNHGVAQMLPNAILTEDPYPIKALIAYRMDPLMSIPDTNTTKRALSKLDLLVSIEINYSDFAWYSDIILPESTYLERTDCIMQGNGLKPQMLLREQAVTPRYDTIEGAMILKKIGEKIGIGSYFPYESMDELVDWQLEGTGFIRKDFKKNGFVSYGTEQIFYDRMNKLPLKTPSKKIEFKSSLLEDAGFESFPDYSPVKKPEKGKFRLVIGRSAIHTHVSTQNVDYLNEIQKENLLWINTVRANELGIKNHDYVEIESVCGKGRIKAYVTEFIHPEAVFMLHGFGHEADRAKRSFKQGLSDALIQENLYDKVGGSPAYHDTFVSVTPLADR